ncbi:HSP20-like chaperone [Suillus clintonianus]|uniref:HSP20-like chaperone n=1 Tax=Suillus clintonianus TaxID=1904413 RepID=UPI001B861EF6|nr:HSP20-like chaperone [Suillus clintonianus]KAG2151413.1 HSP20-like chaperone [Suillus clintonianus]
MSIARQLLHEVRPFFRMLEEPFGRSAVAPTYRQRSLFDDPLLPSLAAIRPPVDVTDEGDKYIIEADLPGVKKENVDIRIGDAGRSITIEGKTSSRQTNGELNTGTEATGENAAEGSKAVEKTEPGTQLAMERQGSLSASFIRTVWLPRPIDSSKASAKLQDGILTMTIPKAEDQESIKVPLE